MTENTPKLPKFVKQVRNKNGEIVYSISLTCNGERIRRRGFATPEDAAEIVRQYQRKQHQETRGQIIRDSEAIAIPKSLLSKDCKIASIGSFAEMIVCADLLKRGFDVYRSVSPNSDADLIAARGRRLCRIEVKSGHVKPSGTRAFKKHQLNSEKHDLLAVVYDSLEAIVYSPSLAEFFGAGG